MRARRPDRVALTRSQLVEEPLGGRTWRGALTNLGDRLYTGVTVEIRFIDHDGRDAGGINGRAEQLAPGAEMDLQSRLPTGRTGLRIGSLRWTADGGSNRDRPDPAAALPGEHRRWPASGAL